MANELFNPAKFLPIRIGDKDRFNVFETISLIQSRRIRVYSQKELIEKTAYCYFDRLPQESRAILASGGAYSGTLILQKRNNDNFGTCVIDSANLDFGVIVPNDYQSAGWCMGKDLLLYADLTSRNIRSAYAKVEDLGIKTSGVNIDNIELDRYAFRLLRKTNGSMNEGPVYASIDGTIDLSGNNSMSLYFSYQLGEGTVPKDQIPADVDLARLLTFRIVEYDPNEPSARRLFQVSEAKTPPCTPMPIFGEILSSIDMI